MSVARAKAKAKELFNIGRVYYDRAKNISNRSKRLAENENDWKYYERVGAERIARMWERYERETIEIEKELEKRGIRVVIDTDSAFNNYRIFPVDKWEKYTGKKFDRDKDRHSVVSDCLNKGELRGEYVEII